LKRKFEKDLVVLNNHLIFVKQSENKNIWHGRLAAQDGNLFGLQTFGSNPIRATKKKDLEVKQNNLIFVKQSETINVL